MKIVLNKILPFPGFKYINLFGVLFTRTSNIKEVDINHEAIHTAQMRELLYVFFYILYFIEWIVRLIYTLDAHKAYKSISFEQEAYSNEKDLTYLSKRKHYSQFLQ